MTCAHQAAATKAIMIALSPMATPSSGGKSASTRTICSERTWMFAPVPITSGIETSPNPLHAISSTAPAMLGMTAGRVTRRSVRSRPAPLTRDASSSAGSMFRSPAVISRNAYGTW